jgi:hypothetical protein
MENEVDRHLPITQPMRYSKFIWTITSGIYRKKKVRDFPSYFFQMIPYKTQTHHTQTNLEKFENKKTNTEENKMYNPKNAQEMVTALPKDAILDGVIVSIADGRTKDYIKESALANWKGDIESPAINITIEVVSGENTIQTTQMFTYRDNNGRTEFASGSNLGKYKTKYNKLPEVGDKVKLLTDEMGFAKVKLE